MSEIHVEEAVAIHFSNGWQVGYEPIVRCRDCYFAEEIEGGYWCNRFDNGKEHVTPNGFCAWGERRTNDN